jgi:dipeptidyl aminopeptidase/acylaminoacyl peptidase
MTPIDRFERGLPAALTDLAAPSTPDYLIDILGRTAATSQRPAWASLERWLPVELVNARATTARVPWRQLGALALLAILLAATLAVYIGAQPRLPQPFGPAANGLVVYSKGGDILVRDSIRGTSRPLIATPKTEIADSLSPLGTHVLIVRPEGELLDFFAATIDGRNEVHLGGPYLDVDGIEWSPDEKAILVAHKVGGIPSISIVQADGRGARTLDLGMPANRPSWRPPDGRQISFRGQVGRNWAWFLADADGNDIKQVDVTRELMEAPYEVLAPVWSPTGDRIAFYRLTNTPGNGNGNGMRIHVAEIDRVGAVTTQQTFEFNSSSDEEQDPLWLPDGKRLVFTRYDSGTNYVAIAEPVAGARSHDVDIRTRSKDAGTFRVTVAPDGTYMIVHDWTTNTDRKVDIATGAVTDTDINGDDLVFTQRRAP